MRFASLVLASLLLAGVSSAETIYVTGNTPDSRGGFTTRKTAVDLGALNLNKGEDAPAILARVKEAVQRVCTPHEHVDHQLRDRVERCQKRTLADTLHAMNVPELTKLAGDE